MLKAYNTSIEIINNAESLLIKRLSDKHSSNDKNSTTSESIDTFPKWIINVLLILQNVLKWINFKLFRPFFFLIYGFGSFIKTHIVLYLNKKG